MIIIGYQGIGKSTLVANNPGGKYIDLESGNFWIDGKRSDDWYKPYCKIAADLSSQGFIVFTSSHEVVRNELMKYDEKAVVICPSIKLKDEWIEKLKVRWEESKLDKDYRAYMNAVDRYTDNINELINSSFVVCEIENINYTMKHVTDKLDHYYGHQGVDLVTEYIRVHHN